MAAPAPPPPPAEPDADEWRVLVTYQGTPCARLSVPAVTSPSGRYLEAVVRRHARQHVERAAATERTQRRLGAPPAPAPAALRTSVVVCTHRRPDDIARLLPALAQLDPAPDEVVVVDNAPGDADCRAVAEAHGAVYVREDRPGLDRARQAGVAAATGELLCFTDDDCVPAPHWLRSMARHFADPAVGAVTGPGFAYELRTRAQLRFEATGGFSRGLVERQVDWLALAPPQAGSMGAGANMSFRRSLLAELGDPFPVDLDAGTPTQSGGDLVALHRVLASGRRIVYDPTTWILHRHRRDPTALHHATWGYGVGLSAVYAKLLLQERETSVLGASLWLLSNYRTTLLHRLDGRADAVDQRIAWDQVRGGLVGARVWWRTRAARQDPPPAAPPAVPDVVRPAPQAPQEIPDVTVVVTTRARPDALHACLGALARQDAPPGSFEVLVVDDDPNGSATAPTSVGPARARVLHGDGRGAARARNLGARSAAGRVLLFLDDDLVPDPRLVALHREAHASDGVREGDLVVGTCPPEPVLPNLVSSSARLWWWDHYSVKARAGSLTFTDTLSGNASIDRSAFLDVGGFDDAFGVHRREDWAFGLRLLEHGRQLHYLPHALAPHRFRLDARGALRARRAEGAGDALLLDRWPEAATALPQWSGPRSWRTGLEHRLLDHPTAWAAAARWLEVLEALRARSAWRRLFWTMSGHAYRRGREEHPGAPAPAGPGPAIDLELAETAPVAPPGAIAPDVRVLWRGEELGRLRPVDGQWDARTLGREAVDRASPAAWAACAPRAFPMAWWDEGQPHREQEAVHTPAARAAWPAIDARLRASTADVAIVHLVEPADAEGALPADALAVFDDPAVVAAFGDVDPTGRVGAASVRSEAVHGRDPVPDLDSVAYLAVRPEAYRRLGHLDAVASAIGPQASALRIVHELLRMGGRVAEQTIPVAPGAEPNRRLARFERRQLAGALAVSRGRGRGPVRFAGAVARGTPLRRSPRALAIGAGAYYLGVARALAMRRG